MVTVAVPDTPGISVRCFTPLRTLGELAAAGHVDTAGEVGRALVGAGERPEALVESMLRLGLTRRTAGHTQSQPPAASTSPETGPASRRGPEQLGGVRFQASRTTPPRTTR